MSSSRLGVGVGSVWARARPYAIPLAVIAILLGVLGYRLRAPVPVRLVAVERGVVVREAFGRGTVEAEREADVGFDMPGRLSRVLVDEGARVTLGQELAQLETDQTEAGLRVAGAGVSAARTTLRRLASEEERVHAMLTIAERENARVEALHADGVISDRERDDAADRVRLAQIDLDRVLAQRAEATRGVDVAAGGAEERRVALVRATLLAPFDGLVTRRLRDPGDIVALGSTVLRLVDTTRVVIVVALDETVLDALAIDQRATIWFPGSDTPVEGALTAMAWESDRQTHELLVEVTPVSLSRRVAIGQRADVRIQLERREGVVRIPIEALHQDAAGPFVYVDQGGLIAEVRPTLGITGRDHVEVLDSLRETDRVLVAPGTATSLPVGRAWAAR